MLQMKQWSVVSVEPETYQRHRLDYYLCTSLGKVQVRRTGMYETRMSGCA